MSHNCRLRCYDMNRHGCQWPPRDPVHGKWVLRLDNRDNTQRKGGSQEVWLQICSALVPSNLTLPNGMYPGTCLVRLLPVLHKSMKLTMFGTRPGFKGRSRFGALEAIGRNTVLSTLCLGLYEAHLGAAGSKNDSKLHVAMPLIQKELEPLREVLAAKSHGRSR